MKIRLFNGDDERNMNREYSRYLNIYKLYRYTYYMCVYLNTYVHKKYTF